MDKDIKDTQIAIIEDKYSSIRNLISDVESKNDSAYNIDIFEIIEESKSYIENVTFSLNSMTNSMGYFSERMNYRAEELNKVNQIKDTRLKTNKVLKTVNYLAEELEEFNLRINKEIPFFSENFKAAGKSYSKLLLAYKGNNSEEVTELKSNIKLFVDNVEIALNSSVILLQTVINLPLINTKFNQSKRETELSIKNITKEMLDGLLIFENAINE